MAVQVRETKAGKSISAYVVLNKKGEHVATVNMHFSDGGRVTADVWNIGDKAVQACRIAAIKCGALKPETFVKAVEASKVKRDWGNRQDHESHATYDLFGMQQGAAGGYGYDKATAALSGIWIDGHQLADHSRMSPATERLMSQYKRECEGFKVTTPIEGQGVSVSYALPAGFHKEWNLKAAKIGAYFTNFNGGRYTSIYLDSGLARLEKLGYRVIQAI